MHQLRGQEWQALRLHVIARDGRCTVAEHDQGVRCAPGALHVHEIDPEGDPYDPGNYTAVCASHHARWHHLRRGTLRPRPLPHPPRRRRATA